MIRKTVKKYVRSISYIDFKNKYGYSPILNNLLRDHREYERCGVPVPNLIRFSGRKKHPVFYFERASDLDHPTLREKIPEILDIAFKMLSNGYHFDISPTNFGLCSRKLVFRDTFGLKKMKKTKVETESMVRKIIDYEKMVFKKKRRDNLEFESELRVLILNRFNEEMTGEVSETGNGKSKPNEINITHDEGKQRAIILNKKAFKSHVSLKTQKI